MFQGSWKLSLRNAFKNFRKHYRTETEDHDNEIHTAGEPHAKRLRFYAGDEPPIGDEEYEEAIEKLQEDYRSKGKNRKGKGHGYVKNLMEITRIRRHQWIQSGRPLISDILEKFPHLSISKWVGLVEYVHT